MGKKGVELAYRQVRVREQASRQRGRDDAAEGGEATVLISPPEERPNGRFVQILLSQKSLSA